MKRPVNRQRMKPPPDRIYLQFICCKLTDCVLIYCLITYALHYFSGFLSLFTSFVHMLTLIKVCLLHLIHSKAPVELLLTCGRRHSLVWV